MSAYAPKEAYDATQIDDNLFDDVTFPSAKTEGWQYTPLASRIKKSNITTRAGAVHYDDKNAHYFSQLSPEDTKFFEVISHFNDKINLFNNNNIEQIPKLNNKKLVVCDIPANTQVHIPLLLALSVGQQAYFQPLVVFNVGKGATIVLNETAETATNAWLNRSLHFNIDEDAQVLHTVNGAQSESATTTCATSVILGANASYKLNSFLGDAKGGLSRHNISAILQGEGASFDVKAVCLGNGQTHSDLTSFIQHQAPDTHSEQIVRAIVSDKARAVAQGKVLVNADAQRTVSNQQYNSLILSELSDIFTKPELEIYADDVECAHGATTGQLDDNALFYLRSRGISRAQAQKMLTKAFLKDVIADFESESFQEVAEEWLEARLQEVFS